MLVGLFEAWLFDISAPQPSAGARDAGPRCSRPSRSVFLISAGGDGPGTPWARRSSSVDWVARAGPGTPFLDQLPFVPGSHRRLGAVLYPSIFIPTFFSLEALVWLLVRSTLLLHPAFQLVSATRHI